MPKLGPIVLPTKASLQRLYPLEQNNHSKGKGYIHTSNKCLAHGGCERLSHQGKEDNKERWYVIDHESDHASGLRGTIAAVTIAHINMHCLQAHQR